MGVALRGAEHELATNFAFDSHRGNSVSIAACFPSAELDCGLQISQTLHALAFPWETSRSAPLNCTRLRDRKVDAVVSGRSSLPAVTCWAMRCRVRAGRLTGSNGWLKCGRIVLGVATLSRSYEHTDRATVVLGGFCW